jgi:serine phosphatase RsbU (regulator of sigma subunit)
MTSPRFEWKVPNGDDQVFQIASPEVLIGREVDTDLHIASLQVSRHHAKVVIAPEGHQIVDLGSTFGTFVNNERVKSRLLRHGDEITFGKHSVSFRYLSGGPARPPENDLAKMGTSPDFALRNRETSSSSPPTNIVQRSFDDLSRATSDLEKMLCVLDFHYQWNQVFTPESGLEQVLESALKISGAERAFIMTRHGDEFRYATGLDGKGSRLLESHFQTSHSIVREVVSKGKPVFMVEGIDANFAAQASIIAMNLRAIACMPLLGLPADGGASQIHGILYLDSTNAMHSLSGLDQKILSKLAVEAGNVLEHVEMIKNLEQRKTMERDLALAEETQRNLLPRELPELEHLTLHAFSKPTRYVGGDFYHFELMESREFIGVLADVSGKGVAASLLSSMLLGCLQILLRGGHRPEAALNQLNKFLQEKTTGKFATMFLFAVDQLGKGDYISAGHNPAYMYRAAKSEIEELESNCMILGALDFATFEPRPFEMHPGDLLMVYSDGLTEAGNPAGEMFGEERVKEIVLKEASAGPAQLQKAMLAAVEGFTRGHTQSDDITIVIMQRTGLLSSAKDRTTIS